MTDKPSSTQALIVQLDDLERTLATVRLDLQAPNGVLTVDDALDLRVTLAGTLMRAAAQLAPVYDGPRAATPPR
jgi:hypothetical protein